MKKSVHQELCSIVANFVVSNGSPRSVRKFVDQVADLAIQIEPSENNDPFLKRLSILEAGIKRYGIMVRTSDDGKKIDARKDILKTIKLARKQLRGVL